jgi:hypothetical protein
MKFRVAKKVILRTMIDRAANTWPQIIKRGVTVGAGYSPQYRSGTWRVANLIVYKFLKSLREQRNPSWLRERTA